MLWSSRILLRAALVLVALLVIATALLLSGSADERRITVYSNIANYSVTVVQRNNVDYVGLLELLEPLGTVTTNLNGDRWRLRFNTTESEFSAGQSRARVGASELHLPSNFLLENGRGMVSISSLNLLLPQFVKMPITLNQSARRLFLGNIAVHFTAQIDKTPPSRLVMNFTSPVNPMIATEPGKLRMVFTHEPIVAPGSPTLTFDSKVIPSANFQESNGAAEIVVTSGSPLLASFTNDGRTITISPPTSTSVQGQVQTPTQTNNSTAPTIIASTGPAVPEKQRVFVVIDPAHGGDERGAALTNDLAEKDVTLSIARTLRTEMATRGLPAMLLRDSDQSLTSDQRAAMSNASGAAIYIAVHAASNGNGVRLYTALMPVGGESHSIFLDWNTAQNAYQTVSQIAQAALVAELKNKQIPVRSLSAPLRPLNNITLAAVAIEVSPTTGDASQLTSTEYQQLIAGTIAAGIVNIRDKIQVGQR